MSATHAVDLAALSPERRALYERLRRERQPAAADAGPRPRVPGDAPLPLSCAQERLWMLEQIEPGRAAYNVPVAVRLQGALDVPALRDALGALLERHEVLRATFPLEAGRPVQRIAARGALDLEQDELSAEPDPEAAARRRAGADARRPFDLAGGPLLRARLMRLRADEHVLALVLHHIVSDGWSTAVLVRELVALYAAARDGRPAALPPLPLQYGDFALWQRAALDSARLRSALDFWTRTLAGAPQVLDLPTDHPRPALASGVGAARERGLGRALSAAVAAAAQRSGATPFMLLLAAFQALLARLSGRGDVLVGTPVAGRTHAQLEGLIGCFVNTLVLRGELADDPTFDALLARTRAATLAAQEHQELPFERLVEQLQPAREPGRNPLFQVFFALHNEPLAEPRLPGVRVRPFAVDSGAALFDLSLSLALHGGEWRATATYATDLFDAATVERLLGRYVTLVEAAVRTPQRRVSELPLLEADERRQVLLAGSGASVEPAPRGGLHRLIEAQVARTPDAPAVCFEGRTLSYAELNRRANRLARELRARGVRAETRVGVCLERSLELVLALVAVLKAGGAYVPLDPSYPQQRVAGMLEDAQAALVVTRAALLERLPEVSGECLLLEPGWQGEPDADASDLPDDVDGARLAYVIFTSGSTGRPKGAMNTHAGVCNRLLWMQSEYGLTPEDRVLQKTPFSFDVSVWEFFWPLMAGAVLVVAPPGAHQDSAHLARLVRDEGITTLHFVPSMLQMFLEEPGAAACSSLKRVICSGEALPYDVQQRFFALLGAELHNLYGPTEAAVDVSSWTCRRGDTRRLVPIGRPVAHTRLHVLDRHGEPQPVGVAGELYIGGVQVARGYLNRPDLTAERFVPDPLAAAPGARLYRTGDLARMLPDGAIDFLGRADQQVKIRGQRIELGEIEAALRAHPRLRDAAVSVHTDAAGDAALVAYVATDEPEALEIAALRALLARRLPEAMLPAAFVPLSALPLTPSGKLDRKALPAPAGLAQAAPRPAFAAPRGANEQRVAAAFAEALGRGEIGLDDDFFALGGDSFKAIRAARRLGADLRVIELFRHASVRRLAAYLDAGTDDAPDARAADALVELRAPATPADVTVVAVPYGGGEPIAYAALARALPPGPGLLALELPDRDAAPPGETTVEAVAARAAEAVLRRVRGPVALYGHCVGTAVALETARLLEARGRAPQAVFLAAALAPRRAFARALAAFVRLRQRLTSDAALHRRLRRLGGFDGALDAPEAARLMRRFRSDVQAALDYFARAHARRAPALRAPVLLIFGDQDPFTRAYARRARDWRAFAPAHDVAVVPGGGHYFLKHQAAALGALVTGRLAAAGRALVNRAGAVMSPHAEPHERVHAAATPVVARHAEEVRP